MTTNDLIFIAKANRQGEKYPDTQMLLQNLPVLLRGLGDFDPDLKKIIGVRAWLRSYNSVFN
jgi:hypothetical protein